MEQIIWQAIANAVDFKTLLILAGLYFIYRKINVVENGLRAGLLAHITRIHSNSVTHGDGTISKATLAIAEECNDQYVALGGDGLAKRCMDEIRQLKVK